MKNFEGRWEVAPSGCWEWTGPVGRGGYGQFWDASIDRPRKAHRYALEIATGVKPDRWTFACHHCDNRKCVNPEHLYWGSPADNAADMVSRGRSTLGKGRVRKIAHEDKPIIVERRRRGESYRAIGEAYGVSAPTIHRIVRKALE